MEPPLTLLLLPFSNNSLKQRIQTTHSAEAAIGTVLVDDVGAGDDDEVAMAAAAAAAAVEASEGMAVVVDQAVSTLFVVGISL